MVVVCTPPCACITHGCTRSRPPRHPTGRHQMPLVSFIVCKWSPSMAWLTLLFSGVPLASTTSTRNISTGTQSSTAAGCTLVARTQPDKCNAPAPLAWHRRSRTYATMRVAMWGNVRQCERPQWDAIHVQPSVRCTRVHNKYMWHHFTSRLIFIDSDSVWLLPSIRYFFFGCRSTHVRAAGLPGCVRAGEMPYICMTCNACNPSGHRISVDCIFESTACRR